MNLSPPPDAPLLEARSLTKRFASRGGFFSGKAAGVVAVDEVSLALHIGASVGIVGESGCGKTTLGRLLMGLTEPTKGQVVFEGKDLQALPVSELRSRRRRMQMVFQDPLASLNPRMRVGKAVVEPKIVHGLLASGTSWAQSAKESFSQVGLDGSLIDRFPHELSGGQRQRVCIARALSVDPSVLVADEPVASLDISIQTQILSLFADLFANDRRALVMISHDVRVVKALCRQIVVMYLGRIVERGPASTLFDSPCHPYTRLLVQSICALHPDQKHILGKKIPPPARPTRGCSFAPRCDRAQERCKKEVPPETQSSNDRSACCFFPLETTDVQ